jgi:hypothetical protein
MSRWLADQMLSSLPTGPAKVALHTGTQACAGKTVEHHVHVEQFDPGAWWRCTSCGTTGDGMEINQRLMRLIPQIEAIRLAMDLYPAILLPSEMPPGHIGVFLGGCEVYRVQGIDRPMVAVPGAVDR